MVSRRLLRILLDLCPIVVAYKNYGSRYEGVQKLKRKSCIARSLTHEGFVWWSIGTAEAWRSAIQLDQQIDHIG
jgi:hypothetical protein